MAELRALNSSFANLAEFAGRAVVDIKSVRTAGTNEDGVRLPVMGGEGSGFIFRSDGYIVTNDHVVNGYDKVTVTLRDGREFPGKVTGAGEYDIAVIKIEAKDLPTLAFADSDTVRPGQYAMALGAPFGLENTVTVGHVSAIHRADRVIEGRMYNELIQTDAAINSGNSGGPLVNIDGQVVGINTAVFSPSGSNAGIGFAIPANQARLLAETLIRDGEVTRGYLGVQPETVKEYRLKELNIAGGAQLVQVPADGPAANAGLRKDDIIIRIDGKVIRNSADLRNTFIGRKSGETMRIEYLRDGKTSTVQVVLAEPPPVPAPPANAPRMRPRPRGLVPPEINDMMRRFPERFNAPPNELGDPLPLTQRPRLGVVVGNVAEENQRRFKLPEGLQGAVITEILANGKASELKLAVGDVITRVNDKPVINSSGLTAAMAEVEKGQTVTFEVLRFRNGFRETRTVTTTF
jgi:serine protease Do